MPATPSLPSTLRSLRHDVPPWIVPLPHRAPPPHPPLIGTAGPVGRSCQARSPRGHAGPRGP
jgi:hypothetical protein